MKNLQILRNSCVQKRNYLKGIVDDYDCGLLTSGERKMYGRYEDTSLEERTRADRELTNLDVVITDFDSMLSRMRT